MFFSFLGAIAIVVCRTYPRKGILKLYIGLGLLELLMEFLTYSPLTPLDFTHFLSIFSTVFIAVFLALSVSLMLQELATTEQVTADIIKGGICIYFLFGFLWAFLYDLVHMFDPAAFYAVSPIISTADLTHFSFTTLTTVGYGDISPASNIARVLANLEGIVGVMYPAIFISRLVNQRTTR